MQDEDNAFPYHLHCDFCRDACHSPAETDAPYVQFTNVWNERDHIEAAFKRAVSQTKPPRVWVWIDDGSTDDTAKEILRIAENYPEIEVWLERMPPKKKGNLNTIGRAYTAVMPRLIDRLDSIGIQYFTIQDVDTEPCPNYFARMIWLLENSPKIGACVGTVVGEETLSEAGMPVGGCKVVRWEIVRRIERYWDLSPDTFLNIRTLREGYDLKIWRIPIRQDTPAFSSTERGMFYQGQLNYFIGRPFLGVLLRSLRRVFLRRHGTAMLQGYLHERMKGTWRCDDADVLKFYGYGKSWIWVVYDLLKTRGRYS